MGSKEWFIMSNDGLLPPQGIPQPHRQPSPIRRRLTGTKPFDTISHTFLKWLSRACDGQRGSQGVTGVVFPIFERFPTKTQPVQLLGFHSHGKVCHGSAAQPMQAQVAVGRPLASDQRIACKYPSIQGHSGIALASCYENPQIKWPWGDLIRIEMDLN